MSIETMKLLLVLLVLLPLALAVDLRAWEPNVPVVAAANATGVNATAPAIGVTTANTTAPVVNATAPAVNTTAAPRKRRASRTKPLAAKVLPAPRRAVSAVKPQPKPEAPKISPTLALAEIEFHIRGPNSIIGEDRELFAQRVITELTKGVEQPARRFEVLSVTPGHNSKTGPLVRFRINRVTPRDDARSPGAQELATLFYSRAMDPANVWANLPLLGHVDRTKAIVVNTSKWEPKPKEPTIHAQVRIDVDIRKIEPKIGEFLQAFEVDVAAAVGCEPEQIEATGAEPDENGLSLTSLVVHFDVLSRLRDLPEKEKTPTFIVNEIKKQLLDPKSPLRMRPTLRRADAFFPVQNIMPKVKVNPDWVRDQEQYQVAEITPDPVKYARPYVLPTLYVAAPPVA